MKDLSAKKRDAFAKGRLRHDAIPPDIVAQVTREVEQEMAEEDARYEKLGSRVLVVGLLFVCTVGLVGKFVEIRDNVVTSRPTDASGYAGHDTSSSSDWSTRSASRSDVLDRYGQANCVGTASGIAGVNASDIEWGCRTLLGN